MSARITSDVSDAVHLLKEGHAVAIPTETVYGLASNALDASAVARIFEIKNRPHFDPLIVHVPTIEDAERYVVNFHDTARKLAEKFWPGPLTIVLRKKDIIPDIVTAGMDTVGIRMPDHPVTQELLGQLDFPLAAPSANPFGYISPTTAQHVKDQLGERIDLILDGGSCIVGLESTIIDLSVEVPNILRMGGIPVEAIEDSIGKVNINITSSSSPKAPGMLTVHYAPRKKLFLGNISELIKDNAGKKIAVLSFDTDFPSEKNIVLSHDKNLNEAARNFFGAMRELDRTDCDVIIAELVPESGLGRAINDKLRRAAGNQN